MTNRISLINTGFNGAVEPVNPIPSLFHLPRALEGKEIFPQHAVDIARQVGEYIAKQQDLENNDLQIALEQGDGSEVFKKITALIQGYYRHDFKLIEPTKDELRLFKTSDEINNIMLKNISQMLRRDQSYWQSMMETSQQNSAGDLNPLQIATQQMRQFQEEQRRRQLGL